MDMLGKKGHVQYVKVEIGCCPEVSSTWDGKEVGFCGQLAIKLSLYPEVGWIMWSRKG